MFKKVSQFLDRRGTILGGFLGILLGVMVFLGIWFVALGSPFLMDKLGAVYVFIPEKLGLFHLLSDEDLSTFEVVTPYEDLLEIGEPGSYAVFTDIPVSEVASVAVWYAPANELALSDGGWYALQERKVDIPGEFAVAFEAERAGEYRLLVNELPGGVRRTVTLVPDFTDQNQSVFLWTCLLQNAAVIAFAVLVYRRRNRQRLEQAKELKQDRKDRLSEWLEQEKKVADGAE